MPEELSSCRPVRPFCFKASHLTRRFYPVLLEISVSGYFMAEIQSAWIIMDRRQNSYVFLNCWNLLCVKIRGYYFKSPPVCSWSCLRRHYNSSSSSSFCDCRWSSRSSWWWETLRVCLLTRHRHWIQSTTDHRVTGVSTGVSAVHSSTVC